MCTYVRGGHTSGMSLVTLNFLGVTFRNIVCHGNFRKYDVDAWHEVLMDMRIFIYLGGGGTCTLVLFIFMPRCACAQRAYSITLSVCLSVPAISVPPVEIK